MNTFYVLQVVFTSAISSIDIGMRYKQHMFGKENPEKDLAGFTY
ncbi:MAG TPA: hypothetical protein VD794_11175 [Flavisolibacter sp.]|nr:hypothetical protein [Flavisolibacter sp.]